MLQNMPRKKQPFENIKALQFAKSKEELDDLIVAKLEFCEIRCDFCDPRADLLLKHVKRNALLELVEYIGSPTFEFNDRIMAAIIQCEAKNLFRSGLTKSTAESDMLVLDPEEDDPILEEAWPHLQIVYELLLRVLGNRNLNSKLLRKYLTRDFLNSFVQCFNTEDPREREYVKAVMHRLCSKVIKLRPFIRQSILNLLQDFIYERKRHLGIGEILEILGSIINGFSVPLKPEHRNIMTQILMPLHGSEQLPTYHMHLCFSVLHFIEKDPSLAVDAIQDLLKLWPKTASRKEVLFVNELEELLEIVNPDDFAPLAHGVFKQLARCIRSSHFQVSERALFFWNNEIVVNLMVQYREQAVPILYEALHINSMEHWNHNVQSLSANVLRLLSEIDYDSFDEFQANYENYAEERAKLRHEHQLRVEELVSKVDNLNLQDRPLLGPEVNTAKIFRSVSEQHFNRLSRTRSRDDSEFDDDDPSEQYVRRRSMEGVRYNFAKKTEKPLLPNSLGTPIPGRHATLESVFQNGDLQRTQDAGSGASALEKSSSRGAKESGGATHATTILNASAQPPTQSVEATGDMWADLTSGEMMI
ncbi:Serine/threonine protein phosphatase 2A 57 kDa regulatory subunit B' theta isoform [Porphyridium purpureum]|uniref:Serine/threonine protein phosphatase 2A 57 kDa regulatory subunit B' theta isoform n=1 Tax=Porphyridium purpureum TaxID=35688 RepID=A0A5J4YXF0_PORPP|nr:Serine/threonine protein phosphatase 2A 57 kDa regulatory subunit B' theta isoform [Porphyridium purpureum]|eukprot:POR9125..scf209_3